MPWTRWPAALTVVVETPEGVPVPRVRDVLYRFSPAGAPGAASSAGVPVDRVADLGAELAPVFALLAATEQECQDLLEAAERDAAAIRAEADRRARDVVEAARGQVDARRAAAVARAGQQEAVERARSTAAAGREVAELRERAVRQTPSLVAAAVAGVLALVDDLEPAREPEAGSR